MIEYFPLKAYLCQIPLQDVINAGKEYGVAETIDLYINRSEGCDYQLSNIIYQTWIFIFNRCSHLTNIIK